MCSAMLSGFVEKETDNVTNILFDFAWWLFSLGVYMYILFGRIVRSSVFGVFKPRVFVYTHLISYSGGIFFWYEVCETFNSVKLELTVNDCLL